MCLIKMAIVSSMPALVRPADSCEDDKEIPRKNRRKPSKQQQLKAQHEASDPTVGLLG